MNLSKYQNYINTELNNNFLIAIKRNPKLHEMSSHAIQGGKRLRPAIAYDIFQSISSHPNSSYTEAINNMIISIELLHSTSLIIDDLPSMDNDIERRGKPTIHHKYGTTAAHILAMFFIQKSFQFWTESVNNLDISNLNPNILNEVQTYYTQQMNLATQGQYFDLFAVKENLDDSFLQQLVTLNLNNLNIETETQSTQSIILKSCLLKTAPFFVIAFIGGYLLGKSQNGEIIKDKLAISEVKEIGELFGLAFQISDDFLDINEDNKWDNYVVCVGKTKAYSTFNKIWNSLETKMKHLNIWSPFFIELKNILFKRCYQAMSK